MKRRAFLTVAAATLLTPRAAFAARGLPAGYSPFDAHPFVHPSELRASNVDPVIWPAVRRINKSGWVWTLESCQGHGRAGWSECPLIRLACRHGDAARMLGLLARSAPPHQSFGGENILPGRERTRIEVERHVEPPMRGWYETRVRVYGPHGISVFDRFAEAVCNAR